MLEREWAAAAAAMLEEYVRIKAVATVAGAACTTEFELFRGGRTGGAETPQLLNDMVQWAVGPVVARWRKEGRGFRVAAERQEDPDVPIADLIFWADNAWLLAGSEAEAVGMFQELTRAI
ncbi:MAG: hypothetical protein ACKPKO_59135, partial [Candidatus Fonsibacter sp.]